MKLSMKKTIQKALAVLLIVVSVCGLMDTGNSIIYADVGDSGMIYSYDGELVETIADVPSGEHVSNLEHGKPVKVIGEKTDSSGNLWYQLEYYISKGTTRKTGYCRSSNVRLDKSVVVTATGVANANMSLMAVPGRYSDTQYQVSTIPAGTKLYITDSDNYNGVMYRVYGDVNGSRVYGWVQSSYVTKDAIPDIPTDANYEQTLINQGFPASYARLLAILHEQYPNWVFVPVQTGLDWNTVIAEESKAGRNLIHKSSNDAKKSVASSEYNYYTNTWTIRDSSGWVTAHPDYIAYCMDPRNFLNAENIFMFESLSYSSTHNVAGVQAILKNTFMATDVVDTNSATGETSTLNYANTFMSIGAEVGVSPYHLASRIRQEQGTSGTSPLISGTYAGYPGVYNYFNYGAYGTPDSVLYANGLSYAQNQGWVSRYLSLLGGSKLLAANYINVGQDTLYFQKFNVVYKDKLYTHQYMTNVEAAISEGKSVASAYTDKSQAFVFEIPVYLNMPDAPVQFTASGNRNNYLSAINISGLSLTPTFDGAVTNYTAIVDSSIGSVSVSASPVVSTSKVSGTGSYNLNIGNNTINVTCTSQSGEARTYTITVVRMGMGSADYTLTSANYVIGEYITGVNPGTTVTDFISGFACEGGTVKVLNAAGAEKTGNVGTGDRLAVYVNGALVGLKDIVIYGDISGDGAVTIVDLVRLNRHTLNISKLSGSALAAADVNRNGSVNIQDLVMVNRHTLGIATISQK